MSISCHSHKVRPFSRAAQLLLSVLIISFGASSLWAVAPVTPTDAAGSQDEVFRVMRQDSITAGFTNGDGTGTVFDYSIQTVNNVDYLRMCMVTADHVLNGTTLGALGFRNENPQGTFGTNAFDFNPVQSVVKFGSAGIATANGWAGNGKDTPDIAFIGVTINLSNVGGTPASGPNFNDSTKALLLQAAAADFVPLGSVNNNTNVGAFTFHGYGDSGRAPTAADIANGWNGFQYIHHNNAPNDEQYGILRPLSDTVTINEFQNAQNGNLTGGTYKYNEALRWQLTAGKGYGLSGDSGSAMIDSSNEIVGIFNLSQGTSLRVNNNAANPVVAEGVATGYLESGVALTADYTNWLEQDCSDFMASPVPEPATLLLMLIAISALAIYHYRPCRSTINGV